MKNTTDLLPIGKQEENEWEETLPPVHDVENTGAIPAEILRLATNIAQVKQRLIAFLEDRDPAILGGKNKEPLEGDLFPDWLI